MENIVEKIRLIGKISFITGIVLAALCLILAIDQNAYWLLIGVVLFFGNFVNCIVFYALGEIVEKLQQILTNARKLVSIQTEVNERAKNHE